MSSSAIQSQINPCDQITRGVARGGLTAVSAVAIPVIAAAALGLILAPFALDALLILQGVAQPVTLIWSIPIMLVALPFDLGFGSGVGYAAVQIFKELGEAIQGNAQKCHQHFRNLTEQKEV